MSVPVGSPVDWVPPPPKPERQVELFTDTIPMGGDGRQVIRFQSRETCNFKEDGRKCPQKLLVERVIPTGFQWDENRGGGQLQYDSRNMRYYKRCPIHGPSSDKIMADAKKFYRIPAQEEPRE